MAGACTTDEPGPSSPPGSPTVAPGSGGSIVVGVFGEPATMDPYSPLASDLTWALARPVYPSLFRMLPDGSVEPYLAHDTVFDANDAGSPIHVELEEMYWSDGRRISARDVVASVRRARPPSGFAGMKARAEGRFEVVIEPSRPVGDWGETLATVAFVLPRGRPGGPYGGPFVIGSRVPGLQVVYRPNPEWEGRVLPERISVRFTIGTEMLLALLQRERIDVAWIPSTVNLAQRLDELGSDGAGALGWERVLLEIEEDTVSDQVRTALLSAIDRAAIETGFVRDDGRVADTTIPGPGGRGADGPFDRALPTGRSIDARLVLAAPVGDELLEYVQRMLQVQLRSAGADAELVSIDARTYYGDWEGENPADILLRRRSGSPALRAQDRVRAPTVIPLFHVDTELAWRDVAGAVPNPTFDGPLWNAQEWALTADG